jgi:hypothetical protein
MLIALAEACPKVARPAPGKAPPGPAAPAEKAGFAEKLCVFAFMHPA